MSIPSFIDVVITSAEVIVDSIYSKGAESQKSDNVTIQILSDPVNPDSGKVVLSSTQLGVKKQNQSYQKGVFLNGSNAYINVSNNGSNFKYKVGIDKNSYFFEYDLTSGSGTGVQVELDDNDVWG